MGSVGHSDNQRGSYPILEYKTDLQFAILSPETADATVAFFNAYRERSVPKGTLPVFHVLDKHNHIRSVVGSSNQPLVLLF